MSSGGDIVNELVKALGKGSVEAFDKLYRKFYRKVQRVASAIAGDDAAGKDISQAVFLRIWEKRTFISGTVRDFDSYLFRMTKNESLNYLERVTIPGHDSLPQEMPVLSTEDPGRDIEAEETRKMIGEVLEKMPPQRKRAFLLSREKGMSYKEIADEMGLAPKTVENHISQSLKDFKKTLS